MPGPHAARRSPIVFSLEKTTRRTDPDPGDGRRDSGRSHGWHPRSHRRRKLPQPGTRLAADTPGHDARRSASADRAAAGQDNSRTLVSGRRIAVAGRPVLLQLVADCPQHLGIKTAAVIKVGTATIGPLDRSRRRRRTDSDRYPTLQHPADPRAPGSKYRAPAPSRAPSPQKLDSSNFPMHCKFTSDLSIGRNIRILSVEGRNGVLPRGRSRTGRGMLPRAGVARN